MSSEIEIEIDSVISMASLSGHEESQSLPYYTCIIETFPFVSASLPPTPATSSSPDLYPTKTNSTQSYASDPHANTFKNLSFNRNRTREFLSLLLLGLCLVIAIAVIAIIVIIAFASRNSKALPQPHLQVAAVSLCPFNISSSHVTAKWDWDLALENQYKTDFYYSRFDLQLYYKTKLLSATSLNPFVQPGGNQTVMRAIFGANSVYVEHTLMSNMFEDWNSGAVKFDVEMNIHFWTRSKWSNLKEIDMDMACKDVMVGFSSRNNSMANLVGGPRMCKS